MKQKRLIMRINTKILTLLIIHNFNNSNNQIPKMQITQACRMIVSGAKVQGEQLEAIKLFMQLPENVQAILEASKKEPAILICYKSFTQDARRTGKYFSFQEPEDELKFLEYMLSILCGAPDFLPQHQCNLYLSLEGQLLATAIDKKAGNQFIEEFMERLLTLPTVDEIKLHFVLKILTSCLEQIIYKRKIANSKSMLTFSIINFVKNYGKILLVYIDLVGQKIIEYFDAFHDPIQLVHNLFEVQDSFLRSMGQSELQMPEYEPQTQGDEQKSSKTAHKKKPAIFIMKWQQKSLIQWVLNNCKYINKALTTIKCQQESEFTKSLPKIGPTLSQCLTMILHIHKMAIQQHQTNKNSQLYQIIENMVLVKLIVPFFRQYEKDYLHLRVNSLPGQFHSNFLKLLNKNPQLLKQFIKFQSPNALDPKTQNIIQIQNYCFMVMNTNYFYFQDFHQCPIGLSIKLMYMLTVYALQIFIKSGKKKQEIVLYERQLEEMYEIFFNFFIGTKMINNEQVSSENEEVYTEGRDWQEFITGYLDAYFQQVAKYLPSFFFDQINTYDVGVLRMSMLLQKQKNPYEQLTEQENSQLRKQFPQIEFTGSLKMLSKMLSTIVYHKLACPITITELSYDPQTNTQPLSSQNPSQSPSSQQQQLFANMMPILSCFHSFLRRLEPSPMRAHFFYEFYLMHKSIDIDGYSVCEEKARLCVLYIVGAFMREIIPEEFVLDDNCSMTMNYIAREFGETFEDFIIQTTEAVEKCMYQDEQGVTEYPEIVEYGLGILERICVMLVGRLDNLSTNQQFILLKTSKNYGLNIQLMYETISVMKIRSAVAYQKLFAIAGCFINICGPKKLYDTYKKLLQETLNNIVPDTKDEMIGFYFSGITGILSGLTSQSIFRSAAQLFLLQIRQLKQLNFFQLTEDLLQNIVYFIDQILCNKIHGHVQDQIGLIVWELFCADLEVLAIMAMDTEYEEVCVGLFLKMAKTNEIYPLIALPKLGMEKYPDVLAYYFSRINRVSDISTLQPYIGLQYEWLISFLQQKVDRNQEYLINIPQICSRFMFQSCEKVYRLAHLMGMCSGQAPRDVEGQILACFNDAQSVFYRRAVQAERDRWMPSKEDSQEEEFY